MIKDNKNKKIGIAAVHIWFVIYLFIIFRITVFRSGFSFDNHSDFNLENAFWTMKNSVKIV